ncbi:hypothetical protein J6590_090360 [Homalodisca vitripennis]|nr:hypothetical protein J6590_090360 [Homalodisca vitripennis]
MRRPVVSIEPATDRSRGSHMTQDNIRACAERSVGGKSVTPFLPESNPYGCALLRGLAGKPNGCGLVFTVAGTGEHLRRHFEEYGVGWYISDYKDTFNEYLMREAIFGNRIKRRSLYHSGAFSQVYGHFYRASDLRHQGPYKSTLTQAFRLSRTNDLYSLRRVFRLHFQDSHKTVRDVFLYIFMFKSLHPTDFSMQRSTVMGKKEAAGRIKEDSVN